MIVSNIILDSTLIAMFLNQIIRSVYFNFNQNFILLGTAGLVICLMIIVVIYSEITKQITYPNLLLFGIVAYFTITQIECFLYGLDNQTHSFLTILLSFLTFFQCSFEKNKLILIFICVFILCIVTSLQFNIEQFESVDNLIKLINEKINTIIFIFICYNILNQQQEYRALDSQTQRKSKQLTMDQVLVLQTPHNNSMLDLSHAETNVQQKELLNNLNEAVILAKYNTKNDKQDFLTILFQNQASKAMFGKDNNQLCILFDNLQCDLPLDSCQSQAPIALNNSPPNLEKSGSCQKKVFVSQSNCGFSIQEKKSFSPNSKLFFQQYNESDNILQIKTVLQCILYYCRNLTNLIDPQEPLKLECSYDDNGKQKSIEFIVTIGRDNQLQVIARDVIYLKQLKELLQVNQQKSNMLNYVSHEFRTPLNCIINILQSVVDRVQINQDQLLHIALESSQHLLNLSNDLLDLAQLKNNVFNLVISRFSLNSLAEECINSFQLQAKTQHVEMSLKCNFSTTIFINSDRNRMKQILINLLGNALKFTQDGRVDIILRQYDTFLDIGVKDTGIGISQDNIQKLFKAFSKVDNERSKHMNSSGVGLGLLISNKIAKQLSADNYGIKVQSTEMQYEHHGSYFYFTVKGEINRHLKLMSYKPPQKQLNLSSPFIASDNSQKRAFTYTSIEQRLSPVKNQTKCLHILVVDDNVFNLEVLQLLIKEYFINRIEFKLNVEKVLSGTQAVGVAFNKCCEDCLGFLWIFMDVEMPGLNGIDASRIILAKQPTTKIVLVSGNNPSQQELNQFKQIGIHDYIMKPIQKSKLNNFLDELIKDHQ